MLMMRCACTGVSGPRTLDPNPALTGLTLTRQVSRGEVDKLLDRVDINNDGHVEFGELASALVDWRQVWWGGIA